MSIFSLAGFIFLIATLSLLGYQVIAAFMELGLSDKFVYKNIRLVDILDDKHLAWINDTITSKLLQNIADVFFTTPLFLWFMTGAVLFFLMNAFKRVK